VTRVMLQEWCSRRLQFFGWMPSNDFAARHICMGAPPPPPLLCNAVTHPPPPLSCTLSSLIYLIHFILTMYAFWLCHRAQLGLPLLSPTSNACFAPHSACSPGPLGTSKSFGMLCKRAPPRAASPRAPPPPPALEALCFIKHLASCTAAVTRTIISHLYICKICHAAWSVPQHVIP
jgi:hypothetical protein